MTQTRTSGCQIDLNFIRDRWDRIQRFAIDDPLAATPFSKALALEMDWSDQFTQLAISEYKRFLLLTSVYSDMVPSIHVDTVWHLHLLYTRSYHRICLEALDREFLHHEPSTGNEDEDNKFAQFYLRTLEKYSELFGPAPVEIWGELANTVMTSFPAALLQK